MDIEMAVGGFEETEIVVSACSARGRAAFAAKFGAGAVSVTVPKSRGFEVEAWADAERLGISFPCTRFGRQAIAR
jgi:hypothetical protein